MKEPQTFSHTALQKISYGFLAVLQFFLLVATLIFLPGEYWTLLVGLSVLQALLWLRVILSLFQCYKTYEFQSKVLVIKSLLKARVFPFDSFMGASYNPGKGILTLECSEGAVKIHNSLHQFGAFKKKVLSMVPNSPESTSLGDPLVLKVVRGVWPFYYFFLGVILVFGYQMDPVFLFFRSPLGWLGGVLLCLLALIMILRSLFSAPISYLIAPDYIEVTCLLRKKRHYYDQVLNHGTDLYAHGGAEYFLIKVLFQNGNVVLDELFLDRELQPLSSEILERFKPHKT